MSESPGTGRVPELDGVRGLAILMIVVYHYGFGSIGNDAGRFTALLGGGLSLFWSGVDLFFVLSGFLIGGILIDHRRSGNYFRTFYTRRICRIVPIYYLWMILFLVLAEATLALKRDYLGWHGTLFFPLPDFPQWGYFLFMQNLPMAKGDTFCSPWICATWSLCIEEQFYLLMPLMVWLVSPRKLPAVLVILICLVPVFRLDLYRYHPGWFMYMLLPCRADGLLLGVLCAYLVRNRRCLGHITGRRWRYVLFSILLAGMAGLTIFSAEQHDWFGTLSSREMITFGYTWIDLFYASFLLIVLTSGEGLFARFMRNPGLRHFGKISYCIYLIHLAVLFLVHTVIRNGLAPLVAFVVVWLLAVLSWFLIEKPIVSLGHWLTYGDSSRTTNPEGVRGN